ncbi:uncharacterized protein LOC128239441 [Mya arenaria]|uniref:uncharacterized protein LOC128239441 n=1 Tax=Mya arenaria TaxID=6604 RepID=UPI0022E4BFD2|nr:uncharacterized protein LOC128239441 [Mya arenaria]
MVSKGITKGVQFAVRFAAYSVLCGYISAAMNQYGTISVVGPAFTNREVTLKASPFYPWGCDVEWKFLIENGSQLLSMEGVNNTTRYYEDESFFLKWKASTEFNGSIFYAECATNNTIKTKMISINLRDIVGSCGALGILSPVVRGADVKLAYFPSDLYIHRNTDTGRTWTHNLQDIQLQDGSYEERSVSKYLYILTIFNFKEKDEGPYDLKCNADSKTDSVHLHMLERPSYPVLGPKQLDFNTTQCVYVYGGSDFYCNTENGTEPVQIVIILGQNSFVHEERNGGKGYQIDNIHQQMGGLSRRNVTCRVSNAVLEKPFQVHATLCSVEKGSPPVLSVPEFLEGENSSAICEVRNAIPAPLLEIHVDNVLLGDFQLKYLFNGSSHTFTSTAKVTKSIKLWNGKQMCCVRKSKYAFGPKDVSVCKNISMKYPPSELSMLVNKKRSYRNNVSVCFFHIFCETNESNPPCTIEWSSDNDNSSYFDSKNWTNGEIGSYRSVSNVMYNVTKDRTGGTITCSTRCDYFPSSLTRNYTVYFSGVTTIYLNTTSPVHLRPKSTVAVNCLVDDCNASGQWTLWWKDENSTVLKNCSKTEECLLTLKYAGDGNKTYNCNARKQEEKLKASLTVLMTEGSSSHEKDIHTFSPTFRFPFVDVLIGTGVFGVLFILSLIGRCIFLKRRKANAISTIEIVEDPSDTSSDNGVLHITTGGVQYAVVHRQADAQRTETQQPHDEAGLSYADLDIEFIPAGS